MDRLPKGSQLGTGLNRDRLTAVLSAHGVQPVRQIPIDGTWPALHFRPAKTKARALQDSERTPGAREHIAKTRHAA
jgi:hypothetical protein